MARTKKETLNDGVEVKEKVEKKATTKKNTKIETANSEVVKEMEVVKPNEEVKKAGRRFTQRNSTSQFIDLDKTRVVPVVSVSNHPVGYQCKMTRIFLKWANYGDEHMMTIEEVLSMNSEDGDFLRDKPLLIVDDEEFIEALGLEGLYTLIFEIEDIEKFYSQNISKIESKLEQLPQRTRTSFINRTVNAIQSGQLDNFSVVRLLKRKYNIDVDI